MLIFHLRILGGYQERASHYTQWRSIYTARDVDNAIAKVFPVSFLQEIVCIQSLMKLK